jgi:hypothetical protein
MAQGAGHTETLSQKKDEEHEKRMFLPSYLIFSLSPEPYALSQLAEREVRRLKRHLVCLLTYDHISNIGEYHGR